MAQEAARAAIERDARGAIDAGDLQGAVEILLSGYGSEILGYFAAVLHDVELGREIYAGWSEKVWRDLGDFRGEASLRTWLYRLAAVAVARYLRDPYRRRRTELESGHAELPSSERTATPAYQRTDVKDRFRALRAELSADERALLVLRVDRDLPWRDVAAILDEPDEAALRKRFERLRKRLRELAVAAGLVER